MTNERRLRDPRDCHEEIVAIITYCISLTGSPEEAAEARADVDPAALAAFDEGAYLAALQVDDRVALSWHQRTAVAAMLGGKPGDFYWNEAALGFEQPYLRDDPEVVAHLAERNAQSANINRAIRDRFGMA